jgi:hypothetical protein
MDSQQLAEAALTRICEVGNREAVEIAEAALTELRLRRAGASFFNFRGSKLLEAICTSKVSANISLADSKALFRKWQEMGLGQAQKPVISDEALWADYWLTDRLECGASGEWASTKVQRVYALAQELSGLRGDFVFQTMRESFARGKHV